MAAGGDVVCLWVLLAVARGSIAWVLVFVGVQGVGGDVAGESHHSEHRQPWALVNANRTLVLMGVLMPTGRCREYCGCWRWWLRLTPLVM